MHLTARRLLLPLTLTLLPSTALAQSLAICHVGGPGSTSQAKPVLDKFLRHIESASGLPAGSMKGEYHNTLSGCLAYIKKSNPLLGVFDLPTFLAHRKALKLQPMACMGSATGQSYHLLVREGSFKDLGALKGKTLYVTLDDMTFVSKVVLGGKVDAAKHFKVKTSRRPLKGIRKVARGKAEATLVDAMARDHLKELDLPAKLVSIHSSPGMPGLTMAVLGTAKANPTVVKKITAALPKLCSGDGKKMCKTFQVTAFTKVKQAIYRRLAKKYGR